MLARTVCRQHIHVASVAILARRVNSFALGAGRMPFRVVAGHVDDGVEVEDFFYAVRTCGMLAAICSVFEAEQVEKGMVISAYGRLCLHEIQIRENRVMLGSQAIADKTANIREHFFVGRQITRLPGKGSSATSSTMRGRSCR